MAIKITIEQLMDGDPAMKRVGADKMDIRIAYTFHLNMKKLRAHVEAAQEQRQSLLQKYGETSNGGITYNVPLLKQAAFQKEWDKLNNTEIEIDIQKIKLSGITRDVAPTDLMLLDWLFEDDTQEKKPRKKPK